MKTPKAVRELKQSVQHLREAITEDINNENVARIDMFLIATISSLPSQLSLALEQWRNEINDIETLDVHRYIKDGQVINVEIFKTSGNQESTLWVARDADATKDRPDIVKSHTRAGIEGGLNKLNYIYLLS